MHRLILLSLLLLFSCDQIRQMLAGEETSVLDSNPHVIKRYYDNGRLRSYYEVNDLKQKHGDARFYSDKGILKKSFVYETNEKVKAIQYYDTGTPILEINYKNNEKDGPLRRYYDNGQLESETPYRYDYPGTGIKEYTKSGKLKTKYPNLIVEAKNNLYKTGEYIIEVYFDKQPARGKYYIGKLTEDQFMNYSLDELPKTNYRGRFVIKPAPGAMIMEKLNFVGEYKTPTGNKYITQQSFNLAVDFGF